MWLARHIKKNVSKTLEFPLISYKNFETYSYSMYIWFSPEAKKSRQSGQFLIVCKLLVYVVITAMFATNTNPTITRTFLTSEGISQAIIAQNVTFRSGFHAKSMHFSPHFLPLQCDRWYVIALHTGSPLSENDTNVFDRSRLVFIKSFRSKTRLCKREVFTANFLITKLQRDNDIS